MPYIVKKNIATVKEVQVNFDDILNDIFDADVITKTRNVTKGSTITRYVSETPQELKDAGLVIRLTEVLKSFNERYSKLFEADRKSLYREFKIPKRSGGLRTIDAPNDELKFALSELKYILENEFGLLYHTAAYAYVKDRCTVDAVKRHQANNSRWFLKTDFSGFFPSTTLEFTMKMMSMIYPFSELVKHDDGREELERALSLGFLNGGLPQGTPLSPTLTNAIMIPIDHYLSKHFSELSMVYTRYADDIDVSSKYSFNYKDTVEYINDIVKKFGAPYTIKPEKTHYGSSAGKNWMLGVMLNADNKITIGHREKKYLKAMLNNYIRDYKAGVQWDISDVQTMVGKISYYKMVESDTIMFIIKQYNEKYNVDVGKMLKADIGGRSRVSK